jgi:acyl-coenzyme A thioesterase PaaI-like protein
LHTGVVIAAMDSACGSAAFTLIEPKPAVLTVELKGNLLSVASGERLLARGQVIRPGRTITVSEGTLMPGRAGRNATWRPYSLR